MANGHGGRRVASKDKKIGRPRNEAKAIAHLVRDTQHEVSALREELQKGFFGGLRNMADRFPTVMRNMLLKAAPPGEETCQNCAKARILGALLCQYHLGDTEAQKFISERFLKFFTPDIIVEAGESPATILLQRIRQDLQEANKPKVIEGEIHILDENVS